jgi:hypothetical protein
MNTTNIKLEQVNSGYVYTGKILLQVLSILLVVYLAFFFYIAVHEWAGHILADALVFARHGTYLESLKVIVQWLSITMENGHWFVGLEPFRIGGITFATAHDHDLIPFTKWDNGFTLLWGSGITTLVSLIFLTVLNFRKNIRHFPWFASAFALSSVIFDQIIYTFVDPPDALIGATLMGIDPILFKGLVICLVLLQSWLLVRFVLHYRRARRTTT